MSNPGSTRPTVTPAPSDATALPWGSIPAGPHDVRLVVADMDGTLLTEAGEVPDTFWPLLDHMQQRGITFVPASGRPYARLSGMFEHAGEGVSFIAENGSFVVHQGEVVSADHLDAATVHRLIDTARQAPQTKDLCLVLCGMEGCYLERHESAFLAEVEDYFPNVNFVDDLQQVVDRVLKVAIYDFGDTEHTAATTFAGYNRNHQVVVSAPRWIDVMSRGVDKGRGVRALQKVLGVTREQTVVFGDYLNDLEMLGEADWSFAMANAHPTIRTTARYLAPTNRERGVVSVMSHLLGV